MIKLKMYWSKLFCLDLKSWVLIKKLLWKMFEKVRVPKSSVCHWFHFRSLLGSEFDYSSIKPQMNFPIFILILH